MTGRLAGKRVLIVEDEHYIAHQLKRVLTIEGAIVLGPVGDVEDGAAMARNEDLDGALLDISLDEEFTYPIADALSLRGVPWLFVTGYDHWAIPPPYREAPRLSKPFTASRVIDALADITVERAV